MKQGSRAGDETGSKIRTVRMNPPHRCDFVTGSAVFSFLETEYNCALLGHDLCENSKNQYFKKIFEKKSHIILENEKSENIIKERTKGKLPEVMEEKPCYASLQLRILKA